MDTVNTIKERIKQLITAKGLTSAKFADIIGVQRSGISHILSGRNKPGLDILNKILINFPDISGDWLITGEGGMLKNKNKPDTAHGQELFPSENGYEKEVKKADATENVNKEEDPPFYGNKVYPAEGGRKNTAKKMPSRGQPDSPLGMTDKKIEKIVVFYTDRTFREYGPDE